MSILGNFRPLIESASIYHFTEDFRRSPLNRHRRQERLLIQLRLFSVRLCLGSIVHGHFPKNLRGGSDHHHEILWVIYHWHWPN